MSALLELNIGNHLIAFVLSSGTSKICILTVALAPAKPSLSIIKISLEVE
jgi:hypothetical protein